MRGARCGRPALLRELRTPSQWGLRPARAAANRKRPTHVRIPAALLAVIVAAALAIGFGIGSSSGGTTTTGAVTAKSTVTSTTKTAGSTGTTTSSTTGESYSSQEKNDKSVVSEP